MSNLVQEEIRKITRDGISSKEEEDGFSLVSKGKKAKGKKSQCEAHSSQEGKKKYLSKIKCFHYHEFRHYATKFSQKKESKKEHKIEATSEALDLLFELEFTLIACMVSTVMGSMWYLDSDVLFHMTGNREFYGDVEDKDIQMNIEFGDDRRYIVTEIGKITF